MTINQILTSMKSIILTGQDGSSAALDARVLVCHVLAINNTKLLSILNDSITSSEERVLLDLARERARGTPIAYLVGHKEFMALSFIVDKRVLIPRPDTECLVTAALELIEQVKNRDSDYYVHDCCTGSSCIITSLAFYNKNLWPRLKFSASDISQEALDLAQINIDSIVPGCEIKLYNSDLFANVDICRHPTIGDVQFDLICSNPPYVPENQLSQGMPASYWGEPTIALSGGQDGLDIYKKLIPQAFKKLKKDGNLILEIGDNQETRIRQLLESAQFSSIVTKLDLAGNPRCMVALK